MSSYRPIKRLNSYKLINHQSTMRVTFKSFGLLRRIIGKRVIEIHVADDATISDVLDYIVDEWGEEASNLIMDNGKISGNLIILLNMKDIDTLEGERTLVKENDQVAVLPHVQGG